MGAPGPALLDTVAAALPDAPPGLRLGALAARVNAALACPYARDSIANALKHLIAEGRAAFVGRTSHRLYAKAGALPADEATREASRHRAGAPPAIDPTPALAVLARRGFKIARNEALGCWIVGGQKMGAAAIVRQAEILLRARRSPVA